MIPWDYAHQNLKNHAEPDWDLLFSAAICGLSFALLIYCILY